MSMELILLCFITLVAFGGLAAALRNSDKR